MNLKDGISIIVTVYNKEKFIENTLESIFSQMSKFSQLIIVDDGSTDNSLKIVSQKIKDKRSDIKLLSQINSGPSLAINHALKFVKYSYIKFVDGDDVLAPDALSYMKKEMERLDLNLLYGYWEWTSNINKFRFKNHYFASRVLRNPIEKFLKSGWGGSSNSMIKTSSFLKVGGCDKKVFVQDYSIPIRIAGYHLKNRTNERFLIGQSDKTICIGPEFIENRVMDNSGQTLYDLSLATINFIETHRFLDKKLKNYCKRKIISRCWAWQRRKNNSSFFSKSFFRYLASQFYCNFSTEILRLIVFETWRNNKNIKKIHNINKESKKILVYVGLDLLGDALLKLPFLKNIKLIYPNSHITWLAGKGNSIFNSDLKFLSNRLINKIIDNGKVGSSIKEFFKPLKLGSYDIVIDTQKRLLTTLILKKVPTKLFISASCSFLFSDLFPVQKQSKNLSRQLLGLSELLTDKKITFCSNVDNSKKKKVAICPGASVEWKRWPINNFIEIANFLLMKKISPIFILGPNEIDLQKKLKSSFKKKLHIFKSKNPLQTIEIAKKCKFGISNDTGCGHLLSITGIPIITIFGPTDHLKFSPIGNEKNVSISSLKLYKSKDISRIDTKFVKNKIVDLISN